MFKKFLLIALSVSLGSVSMVQLSFGESTTTIVDTSSTETVVTPRSTKKVKPVKARTVVTPASTTTTTSNTSASTTVEVKPRQAMTEDTLKKISKTLCTVGFKAYVGTEKKNVCQSKVTSPDIAYSCVWDKKGTAAYAPTTQGPCSLDYAEHRGKIVMTKDKFSSKPPLSYGVEAECCYRAAVGSISFN